MNYAVAAGCSLKVVESVSGMSASSDGANSAKSNTETESNTEGVTMKPAVAVLDQEVRKEITQELGPLVVRDDVQSSIGSFQVFPNYRVKYPEVIVEALGQLYTEYNHAFVPLLEKNREWDTDYRYCLHAGLPLNFAVQIDMVGLPQSFLDEAVSMPVATVREALRGRIYEVENSLAMYQLLEKCCENGSDSFFKRRFRLILGKIRKKFNKPIALLAVTQQKYDAMLTSEFGRAPGEGISDDTVRALSGFDRFFGPDEFRAYLAGNNGKCGFLLYVRSSDPVAKLKRPDYVVEHPLLADPKMRKLIKAHAITFNIDAPDMDHARRINDTKEYQSRIGMGFPIDVSEDLLSLEFATHLYAGNAYSEYVGPRLSPQFVAFLRQQGVDPKEVESGKVALHCKPIKCAYGCYGHVAGVLTDQKFRGELRRHMRQRGAYVVQIEMPAPTITDVDGSVYTYIDRNFMGDLAGKPVFIGGFRSLMPVDCHEIKKGRNHGSDSTIWAEIISD